MFSLWVIHSDKFVYSVCSSETLFSHSGIEMGELNLVQSTESSSHFLRIASVRAAFTAYSECLNDLGREDNM